MKLSRILALLALTAVCAVAVALLLDEDLPSNAVAKVGDVVITEQSFDHWYASAAKTQAQQGGPAPPDQLKRQVMQFLIQAQWVVQETEDKGIEVSDKEVWNLYSDQRKQAFPKEADFQKFLRTSGATEEDILFRIKLEALQNKLMTKIQEDQEKVTPADLRAYYAKNKERFAQPERRDLNVVITKTEAKAEAAKQQLDDGADFAAVAKRYSIDRTSKAKGGKMPDAAKGQQEKALDEAIFSAEKGETVGPVKTKIGWYVFEVTKTTPATQQELKEVKETVRGLLQSEREQKPLQDFIEDFQQRYRDATVCREEYATPECSNGPDEEEADVSATQPSTSSNGTP